MSTHPRLLARMSTQSYKDERVCRNMLCEFCPYELFNNTKEDHGECTFEVHDEKWREEYVSRLCWFLVMC